MKRLILQAQGIASSYLGELRRVTLLHLEIRLLYWTPLY